MTKQHQSSACTTGNSNADDISGMVNPRALFVPVSTEFLLRGHPSYAGCPTKASGNQNCGTTN